MSDDRNINSKLAQYLRRAKNPDFPLSGVDYFERFRRIDEYLNAEVHPVVNQGSAMDEASVRRLWLTDHGPDHISTVIDRASKLLFVGDSRDCVLSPYEAYLLLTAIHFHDVGNVYGREEHEKRVRRVMAHIDPALIGSDSIEKRLIQNIALAHGGLIDGNKDTIGSLPGPTTQGPRVRLLAAVLRFADELAEDHTRTKRFLVTDQLLRERLGGSEAYHLYADRLRRVIVQPADATIRLHFEINVDLIRNRVQKDDGSIFLFDEIVARSLKLYREHVYCTRFMQPFVHFSAVEIKISFCSEDYMEELDSVTFRMQERGYPATSNDLLLLCPELNELSFQFTGEGLRTRFATPPALWSE